MEKSDEKIDLEDLMELKPDKRSRFRRIPLRVLLPNIITLLAICSGVTAIKLGIDGRYELAVGAILLACLLDALDGRVARMLKGATKFGAELDSLADFVNFGVAPAILVYNWSLAELNNLGWIASLMLAICCALRLARFNVAIEDPDKPAWAVNFFTGIPAPSGALLAPLYLGFLDLIENGRDVAWAVLPWVVLVGAGMISQLPTFSGKKIGARVPRNLIIAVLMGFAFFAVFVFSYPWLTLTFLSTVYVLLIPVSAHSYRKQYKAWQDRREHTKGPDSGTSKASETKA